MDNIVEGEPLISVIVPIFNVEKYVGRCLDSLANQTMTQIEVICIDDGSSDRSGEIAERYSADKRFKIIHTENRGLSAARNRGIDESRADWIMFVDSDDWVDKDFCRIPYKAALESGADMVIFCNDNGKKSGKKLKITLGIIDESTAHEYGNVAVWNKLYKKNLYKAIRYPEGHNYEDLATTHKIVHEAKTIFLIEEFLYHHISREGSITKTISKSNKRDQMVSMLERCEFLAKYGFPIEIMESRLIGAAIVYLFVTSSCKDDVWKKAKEIADSSKGVPKLLNWKQRVLLIIWKINSELFFTIAKIARRVAKVDESGL